LSEKKNESEKEIDMYIIYGDLQRKSNSRRIVKNKRTGRILIIKSAKALQYEKQFLSQISRYEPYSCLICDVVLTAYIYYSSRRFDVSEELLMDLIQKCKLVKNDRQIREKHIYGRIDRENPRVQFEIKILRL